MPQQPADPPPPVSIRLMASCSGAFLTSFFTTPFDAVKVRLQLQQQNLASNLSAPNCAAPDWRRLPRLLSQGPWGDSALRCCGAHECLTLTRCQNPQNIRYTGLVNAFMSIAKHEGPTALWRGLTPTLLMSVPSTMVYFTANDQITYALRALSSSSSSSASLSGFSRLADSLVPAISGSCARVGAVILMGPLELVRTRIQAGTEDVSASLRQYFRTIIQNEGLLGLWRGVRPTLWRDVPFSALYWTVVDDITGRLRSRSTEPNSGWQSFKIAFAAGAGAGFVAALVTNPFDVAKTRVQVAEHSSDGLATFRILSSVYQTEGVSGLMSGIVPRVVRIVPACAIMIGSYELGKYLYTASKTSAV